MFAPLTLLLLSNPAEASSKCNRYIRAAESFNADKQDGAKLVRTFNSLVTCDKKFAEESFIPSFLPKAKQLSTFVALSEAAISQDIWKPTWKMIGNIPDYSMRKELTASIGEKCSTNPKIVQFLQGGYYGLKAIEFQRWNDAFKYCENDELSNWLKTTVEAPPSVPSDEKYDSLMSIYVNKVGPSSVSSLKNAAIMSTDGGPFNQVVNQMRNAVSPSLGGEMTAENKVLLEDALIEVSEKASTEQVMRISKLLSNAKSSRVAELLPRLYPDRLSNGKYSYAVVAVEAGECKGKKQAVIHYATVTDPAKRLTVLEDVKEPIRSSKPRLRKCDTGEWSVSVSPEPLAKNENPTDLAEKIKTDFLSKGYKVKLRQEKSIILD